jgi:hypothetical protein
MAYTLTDPFRSLRTVLRISGTTMAICGAGLLFAPISRLAAWGVAGAGPTWPVRLAGALLITLSVTYLLTAGERRVATPGMVACVLGNGLVAVVLFLAYFRQELTNLSWIGLAVLIIVFVVSLIGAVAPLRYLRAEYRDD